MSEQNLFDASKALTEKVHPINLVDVAVKKFLIVRRHPRKSDLRHEKAEASEILRVAQPSQVSIVKVPLVVGEEGDDFREFVDFPVDLDELRLLVGELEAAVDDERGDEVVENLQKLRQIKVLRGVVADDPEAALDLDGVSVIGSSTRIKVAAGFPPHE